MHRHASMNRIYRLVWNEALNAYVPAAETARGRGKRGKRRLMAAALSLSATIAHAGPTGGQVTAGNGTISRTGATTTIQQSTQNLGIDWQTFNVAPQETVNFVQPASTAVAVNRILDPNGSVILGHLNANGQVYLINPNGVLFGKGAAVNVGGLVASALELQPGSAGDTRTFSGNGSGSVQNAGTITAADGGTVALLGHHVGNTGTISAQLGSVALGAGSAATLTFSGTRLVSLQVDQGVLNSVASNGGLIRADGGAVLMTAGAQKSLLASVVNNTGVIEARTIENHDGTITLRGGMTAGTADVGGVLDASAPTGGHGGAIETSAARVRIAGSAKVTTAAALGLSGSWLIDPADFTVAASGGDETGAQLSAALAGGNVQIQSSGGGAGTSGNVNVDDVVAWGAHTLTLTAINDININAAMNGSGTASLALQYGQGAVSASNPATYHVSAPVNLPAGPHFSTQLGTDGLVNSFTVITTLGAAGSTNGADLQGMGGALTTNYALGADIDASATAGWNAGAGFAPVGTGSGAAFNATFDGLGHTISNLFINRPTPYVGMFGFVDTGGVIANAALVNANVTGGTSGNQAAAGILVGASFGRVANSRTSGTLAEAYSWPTGGLVGDNSGTIDGSHSSATVSGIGLVGGLVGSNEGSISHSFATGQVGGLDRYIGGLVGESTGSVDTSYATGSVAGSGYVGGLMGADEGGSISNSHATGAVSCLNACTSANQYMGGLVGLVNVQYSGNTPIFGTVSSSYATGTVTGGTYVAGLVGGEVLSPINNSYSTGAVVGIAEVGGLIGNWLGGNSGGTLSNSFYDIDQVTINGLHKLTFGGVYDAQYQDWITHGQTLQIANYAATLPSGSGGYHDVGSVQGLRDMLGFVESDAADNFRLTANLSLPAGFSFPYFAGSFDGGNHTLANLSLNAANSNAGLFGYLPSSSTTIANVGVPGANVTGLNQVGGLVGLNNGAAISNSYVSGSVSGGSNVGGLVGYSKSGSVANSYSSASVMGSYGVGGLVGANYGAIDRSYATGVVNGSNYVGGLAGLQYGTAENSYYDKTANPTLTGLSNYNGPIADVPGVVSGLTTAELKTQSSFSGWDFGSTWFMYEGATTPLLRQFMTALTVSADNATRTYSGNAYAGGNGVSFNATSGDGNVLGSPTYSGSSQGAVHAGTYAITPSGLYSDQQGYIISYASGSLTIDPAPLTVSGTTVGSRVYNGTTTAVLTGGTLVGVVNGDSVTLTQAGTFASTGPGSGIAVTAADSLGGASAGDYSLTEPTGLTGTILPVPSPPKPPSPPSPPSTPPGKGGSPIPDAALLAARNARAQIEANFIYPQLGAAPQVIEAAPSIQVIAAPDGDAPGSGSTAPVKAIAVNVSMRIGATGTLKIENGGLRLPGNLVVGDE